LLKLAGHGTETPTLVDNDCTGWFLLKTRMEKSS